MNNVSPIKAYHASTTDSWNAMLNACKKAKFSIDLEEFIFDPDEIGSKFCKVLKKKAIEGIKVRLLLDWWGCRKLAKSSIIKEITHENIEINFFRPPQLNWVKSSPRIFPRDHRKILIIDKEISFIGGVCIYDNIKSWRDTMVEISNPLTSQLLHIFDATWNKVKDEVDESEVKAHPDFETDKDFSVYANAPDSNEHNFTNILIKQIKNSKLNIKLATPYFTPGKIILPILLEALERGIKVEILLSNYSKYAPFVVGKKICGKLIKNGAKIYYYEPSMLHLKMMIIDDKWSAIGSFNLDGLSINHNQEAMLVSTQKDFTSELLEHFEKDKSNSLRFSYANWQARPISQKIFGAIMSPVKKYL